MNEERMFPILLGHTRQDKRQEADCPRRVPWSLVAPYEEQAQRNHGGQSLEHLARRGGLSPIELCGIMLGKKWTGLGEISTGFAVKYILERLAAHGDDGARK